MNTFKKFLLIVLIFSLTLSLAPLSLPSFASETALTITDLNKVAVDGMNRYQIFLKTDYSGALFPATRDNSATISLTMNIDGQDFTYAAGKYVVSFGQNIAGAGELAIILKVESGSASGANAEFYPSNYPGIAKGEAHTITLYKDTLIGSYRLTKDVIVIIPANLTNPTLITDPQEIQANGAEITSETFVHGNKTCTNAGATVTFTPNLEIGMIVDTITITKIDGSKTDIVAVEKDGVYSFTMPEYGVKIAVTQKEFCYTLTCGNEKIDVKPFAPIGDLPDGVWYVDGLEISENTVYVWDSNKTATKGNGSTVTLVVDGNIVWKQKYDETQNGADVKFPSLPTREGFSAKWEEVEWDGADKVVNAVYEPITYTLTFIVDGQKYTTLDFDCTTQNIVLPVIPQKDGYIVIGWDIKEITASNQIVNAIYAKILE